MNQRIELKSDVCRDLLQSAALFRHPKNVIWEYVANGIQYQEVGTKPVVKVVLDSNCITISDNGRGMSRQDLQRFFTMHAENEDRKQGKIGRGMFGTGKSAAFGIASSLQVDTIQNGVRNVVELHKAEIQRFIGKGKGVPISDITVNEKTNSKSGTKITITGIGGAFRKQLVIKNIVEMIENELAAADPNVTVYVNGEKCEYQEPESTNTYTYNAEGEFLKILGPVALIIKVAPQPLPKYQQGIKIISSNQVHEVTLAGCDRKDMADRLFGRIEVAKLDTENDPPAYDSSRNGTLNPNNPLVQTLYAFIGPKLELLAEKLQQQKKDAQKSEEAKRFRHLELEISQVINSHFDKLRSELGKASSKKNGGKDITSIPNSADGATNINLVDGGDIPAKEGDMPVVTYRDGDPNPNPLPLPDTNKPNNIAKSLIEDPDEATHQAKLSSHTNIPKAKGGFSVEHEFGGQKNMRARYSPSERVIYVNLDHAQLEAAYSEEGIDSISFRRLFYEVAFTEYTIAVMFEMVSANITFPNSLMFLDEMRRKLNEISLMAAPLFYPTESRSA